MIPSAVNAAIAQRARRLKIGDGQLLNASQSDSCRLAIPGL
jgi:hypothetical protein